MKVNVAQAILALEPTAQFAVIEEDLDQIVWLSDDVTEPSKEDIQAKLDELQAIEDAKQYQRDRKAEYPPIAEQLDYIYHHGVTKWKTDMITPVKEKYPKPE